MLSSRLKNIRSIINGFTGKNGEPKNDTERYILNSMWIMLCSEFEGSVRDLAEKYIDKIKKKNIKDIHVCFLMQGFYGNRDEDKFTVNEVLGLYKKDKKKIDYINFTRNRKARNKSFSVENLFNSLGVFLPIKKIQN